MLYNIKGYEINSENAAKSARQKSAVLVEWISSMDKVDSVMDFGCGKLRYAEDLAKKCKRITFVDSEIQLNRSQTIKGAKISVVEYVKKTWKHGRVVPFENIQNDKMRYDFISCFNVISAIPTKAMINKVMKTIHSKLKASGTCLFVNQYRNSYFKAAMGLDSSISHLYGYISVTKNGASYYGLINKERMLDIGLKNDFKVIEAWINGESSYVLLGR